MALALYDLFGSTVPAVTNATDLNSYSIGMRFRITSSTAISFFQPYTASVVGIKVYRGTVYTGPYTCSLWRVSDTSLMGTVCYIPPKVSETGWVSSSFSPPITISLDTDYVITRYGFANDYTYTSVGPPYYSQSVFNPLVGGLPHYLASGSVAIPAPPYYPTYQPTNTTTWYGIDVVISASKIDYPFVGGTSSSLSNACVNGWMQGISLGGPTSINGDGTFGRHMQVGVSKNTISGSPSAPCLSLDIPGMWRFRWVVKPGIRSIYVNTKQVTTILTSSLRPSIVVKANPDFGLIADVSASAATSQDWVTIGPLSFTATGTGATWVELHNNNVNEFNTPTLFDHIIVT